MKSIRGQEEVTLHLQAAPAHSSHNSAHAILPLTAFPSVSFKGRFSGLLSSLYAECGVCCINSTAYPSRPGKAV